MSIDQVNPDILYLAYWLSPYIDRLIHILTSLAFCLGLLLCTHAMTAWFTVLMETRRRFE